jgi:hypothetical protein
LKILDQIPSFDETKLTGIEQNAKRWMESGTDKQKADAESVLLAIGIERRRRKEGSAERRQQLDIEIAEKVRNKALFDRVVFAFTEVPPADWEVEVLKAISKNPGRDFDALAHAIGKRGGGYINLAVGTLCSEREAYLGVAPMLERKKTYSALLIDFTPHLEPDGSRWHGWTLKPDAGAALRQLGIVD